MPAEVPTINLLDQSDPTHSPFGRMTNWITSYGRYIMITTELIVLFAFASRFSLDRRLTDLKEEITQKEDIITANAELESSIRTTQATLKNTKDLLSLQTLFPDAIDSVVGTLPKGVYFDSLTIRNGKLDASVIATSTNGFSQFVTRLQNEKKLSNIEIKNVAKQQRGNITFYVTALMTQLQQPK